MSQIERLYRIKSLLDSGRIVRRDDTQRSLEISEATLKRDIDYLRDRLGTPIIYDRAAGGWRLDSTRAGRADLHELPGLWMSRQEIVALMLAHRMLCQIDSSRLLAPHLEPLFERLRRLGESMNAGAEIARRFRLLPMPARRVSSVCFEAVGAALTKRKRIVVRYLSRSRDREAVRELSPQQLIHYRHNWYLLAWCHWRAALRTFSLDAFLTIEPGFQPAIDVCERDINEHIGAGFGVFGGAATEWATLRFSPSIARWIINESWHPAQRSSQEADGSCILQIPFSDPRELAMDVLRHIPEVTVIGPQSLIELVESRIREAHNRLAKRPSAT